MSPDQHSESTRDDAEIRRILEENEAGIGALIDAYEPVERAYFAAVQSQHPAPVYSTNTTSH